MARAFCAAFLSALLVAPAQAEIANEFATLLLVHGALALGAAETEEAYQVVGTSELRGGDAARFVMTVRKAQGCVVSIHTAYEASDAPLRPANLRIVDWSKVRAGEIRVTSAVVPNQGFEDYERTITIPAEDGFQCVREGRGPAHCSTGMQVRGAYVPGGPSIHGAQREALTALMKRCQGKAPDLEPGL